MSILLILHSINRYLVTLVAIALIVRLIIGVIRKQAFDKGAAALTGAFGGLMDLQMLLGVLFFVLDGLAKTGFPQYRWEHVISMVLAVAAAHMPARWKNKDDSVRTRNTLIAVSVSLLLIFIGVSALGVSRWWHITGWF
jgi:uncharacterized membrane protein YfhO